MSMFACFSILALLVPFMTSGQQISMLYESPAPANTTVARMNNAKNDSSSLLCSVAIVIDSSFFVSVANSSATNALQLVKDWMTQVDHAFRSADFNNDTFADNIGLQVVKIALYQNIHDPKDSPARTPIQMLSELSRNDYMFKGACVGLHLVHHSSTTSHTQLKASITSPERGICSESRKTPLQVDPTAKSDFGSNIFNSVPVNFKDVEGARAIAHQLGHLFGALDDEDYAKDGVPCSRNIPAGDRNDYVMLESGLGNGDNRKMVWSDCSLMAINEFLGFKRKASMNCLQECRGDECAVLLPGNRHKEKTARDQPLPKPDVGLLDVDERIRTDAPGQHTPSVSQTKTTPKADTKGSQESKATLTPTTTSFGKATERTTPTVAPKITAGPGTSRDGISSYEILGKSNPNLVTPKLQTQQNFPTTKSVAVTSAATTEDPSDRPSQSDNQSVDMDGEKYQSLNNGNITRFKPPSDNQQQMDDEQPATDEPPKSTLDPNDTYYISFNSSAANIYNVIGCGTMDYKLFIIAVLTLSNVAIYM